MFIMCKLLGVGITGHQIWFQMILHRVHALKQRVGNPILEVSFVLFVKMSQGSTRFSSVDAQNQTFSRQALGNFFNLINSIF